jgi:thioredoxin
MSGGVIEIGTDAEFQPQLTAAGAKLVVVDFYATWCGPCQRIAPLFEQMASKYSNAIFLKVDVDKCPESAAANGVTAMPTFIFFRNAVKIDMQRGGDPATLEQKITKWYGAEEAEESSPVKGFMDLTSFISKAGCECLNESDDHPLEHALNPKGGYLESDCDEQLIISIEFNQKMKIHSFRMNGPADKGPKNVKLFINQPHTLDFDKAEAMEPVEAFELKPEDLEAGATVPVRFVKFQNVDNITVFVKDNQSGDEVTQIEYLGFIGTPQSTTNMGDFKRVAGKKGESH